MKAYNISRISLAVIAASIILNTNTVNNAMINENPPEALEITRHMVKNKKKNKGKWRRS